jgi:anti-sigma B factor antagonist
MQLASHIQGDIMVVTLDGSLDSATAPTVRADLEQIILAHRKILLDLGEISYMSSAGLRMLLLVYRWARSAGASVALACPPEDLREIMAATGFLEFFTVFDAVDTAVEALA